MGLKTEDIALSTVVTFSAVGGDGSDETLDADEGDGGGVSDSPRRKSDASEREAMSTTIAPQRRAQSNHLSILNTERLA